MALASMTRARTNNKEHIPNDLNLEMYKQRSGAGLILTEGSHISPQAIGWVDSPGIYTEAQAAGWKTITDAVSTPMWIQLWHQGRQSHESLVESKDGTVVAPSAIAAAGDVHIREGTVPFPEPRALETDEIPLIVKDYAHAAKLAIEQAGFAGVHIHAANGYLIDEFIQSKTNHREDKYGGSLENRLRFLSEVIDAVLQEVPAERVSIKLSPNGIFGDMGSEDFLETFDAVIEMVAGRRLTFIELMDGLAFGAHQFVKEEPYTMARARSVVKRIQGDNVVTSLMANCGYTLETAEAVIESGDADMVSFGRPYISNPDLEVRFATGAKLNEAQGPETWMSFGVGAKGYTDYPFLE